MASAALPDLPKKAPNPADPSGLLPHDDEETPQDGELRPHHPNGFFNQPWVQNVLPLATSLIFHIVLITIGVLGYRAIKHFSDPNKDQVIIPESKPMEKGTMPGGIEHPGLNNDPTRANAQDIIKKSAEDGMTSNANSSVAAALGGGTGEAAADPFAGTNPSNGKGTAGAGGIGAAFGSGNGGGTAPWGVPGGGGGLLPQSKFMGTGGNATKIIYLCDKSGSMLSVFGALKQQLKESVNSLDVASGQQFNVVFFSDEGADPLFKDGMQIATNDNKKLASDFVDNEVASGGTLPLPAIDFVLKEKPELLYVLTDGFDQIPSYDDVTAAFKKANPNMHINCIFLQSDEDPKLEEFLKAIATQGHGEFKKILKSDM
jgi:hypothetical protein